ncbi:MAG: DUF1203 domain-containing protein [Acidobacteriota bacterium]
MIQYRVIAIPEVITSQVRTTLKSPQYGHPAHVELATGYGPCRFCLKTFQKGEEQRILFTYNPFDGLSALPAPGPIFIHKEDCQQYQGMTFPLELRSLPLVFEGYGQGGLIVEREEIISEKIEEAIERLFINSAVEYINVRNAEAGCFIARIDRIDSENLSI